MTTAPKPEAQVAFITDDGREWCRITDGETGLHRWYWRQPNEAGSHWIEHYEGQEGLAGTLYRVAREADDEVLAAQRDAGQRIDDMRDSYQMLHEATVERLADILRCFPGIEAGEALQEAVRWVTQIHAVRRDLADGSIEAGEVVPLLIAADILNTP